MMKNQRGIISVGLNRNGVQRKRTVSRLVAIAFLPEPQDSNFNTPIHLDGDRSNNRADNLMWRPRWFAIEYQQQFEREEDETPVKEVDSGLRFNSVREAAINYGLLDYLIFMSAVNNTRIRLTNQRFRLV